MENANRKGNSALLDRNQVDTIISSRRIFEFYNGQAARLKEATDIGSDPVFPPSPYRMIWRSAELRDAFKLGLRHWKAKESDRKKKTAP